MTEHKLANTSATPEQPKLMAKKGLHAELYGLA